jgi:hypothetical protein
VTTWLQRPEVIYGTLGSAAQGAAARRTNLGLAVGLAVPLGVCVLALAGTVGTLALRNKRAQEGKAAGGGGGDAGSDGPVKRGAGGSSTGGGPAGGSRSRRGTASSGGGGKRRYIAPPLGALANGQSVEELAAANLRAAGTSGGGASTSGGAGGSGLTAAVVAAHRDALEDSESEGEAGLRPRLRSLGDSVTSAARFEAEDDEEGPSGTGGGGGAAPAGVAAPNSEAADAARPLESRHAARAGSGVLRSSLGSLGSSQTGGSGAAPWPGPVEAPPAVSGPSVIMGAANPPRVGTLASPFGNYNFEELAAPGGDGAGGGGAGSGGSGGGGGAAAAR